MERRMKNSHNFIPAKKLATNQCYTLAINDYDDLYAWGSNKDGRLGHKIEGKKGDILDNPRKYDFFANNYLRIVEVSCGASHIGVVAMDKKEAREESGRVYTWGLPLYGRLGYTDDEETSDAIHGDLMIYKTTPKEVQVPDKVVRVACGTDFTACITVRGQLFTWGTNKSGYLGVENNTYTDKQAIVNLPTLVKSLENKVVTQVVCGSRHMMCLTNEYTVFSWGSGENGVLGHGDTYGVNKPEIIKELKNETIIFIAASDFSSAAINNYGHLFTWGKGKYGILGLGSEENVMIPKRVHDISLDSEQIFFVSLGFYHTICTTLSGKTFAWGYSEKGRLGCIDKAECEAKKRILTPREIHTLRGNSICQVFAGHYHSYAISANGGKVWGWGENTDMLLGVTDEGFDDVNQKKNKKTIYYRPVELKINRNLIRISGGVSDLYEAYFGHSAKVSLGINISQKGKIKKISCGGSHSLALTSQGEVLAWGYGESGQLGLGIIQSQETPCLVFFGKDRKIRKVFAGYSHSMAISTSHEVYVWGEGKKGQTCQINSNEGNYVDQPRAIDELSGREVIQGACGFDNCAVITSDYKLYVWGGNASNKLGLLNSHNEFESTPRLVESLNAVKKVSLGYGHSAVINTNGELYTWGHGFFGQLGHGDSLTKKEPLKVDHLDLKYSKVKCGQYHTLAIDKKNQVYIWGRGGINLNADTTKHKLVPEIVEDFRSSEVIGIEAGMGNSLVLTRENQVFGWGDNSDGKAGGTNKIVAGKAQQIQFEKQKVVKIIAGYSHCFAITESGDIFGWGNNKCFRLTNEVQAPKLGNQILPPKLLSNLVTNISKNDVIQDDKKEKKKDVDERYIQTKLLENKPITSYKELEVLILNDDETKYSDEELKKRDLQLQFAIEEGLKKIENNSGSIRTAHYIEYNQLFTLRLNEIKVKEPQIGIEKYKPAEIFNNVSEIEKIFTLFYLHPCYMKDYFEDDKIKPSNFGEFLTGLRPLFTDLHRFSRKSESLDNMVYLTICKLVIEYDARNYNNEIDSLFLKNKSYAEQLIESYFFNEYGRSILLDIFDKTLNEVYSICLRHSKRAKDLGGDASKNLTEALNDLMELFKNSTDSHEGAKKENIDEAINLMRTFLNDLENNISIVPVYVFFYLTEIKKKFFELLVTAKDSQGQALEKEKIEKAIMRLFYKNVIARLLKELSTDERYMKSHLGIGADVYAKKLFSLYLTIIADFLVKVADNSRIVLEENDETLFSQIDNINKTIKEMHLRVDNIYRTKVINSKYDMKKEILPSIIYSHTTPMVKKMRINLGALINFLRVIFKCLDARQITGNPLFKDYEIFKIFDPTQQTLKSNISFDSTFKLCLYIDVRFLLDHKSYPNRFKVETGSASEQSDEETKISRCKMCHLIVPSNFINRLDKKESFYFQNFQEKIKSTYLSHICNVVRDNAFPRDLPILSLKDFAKAVKDVQDKKQKETNESAREVRNALEEMSNKSNAEEVGFKILINEIYDHLKLQHEHFDFVSKISKVLNDIEDANANYATRIVSINKDIEKAIHSIKTLSPSIEWDSDDRKKEDISNFTFKRRDFKDYETRHLTLDYRVFESPIKNLILKHICLVIDIKDVAQDQLEIQTTPDKSLKLFNISIRTKSKDVKRSLELTYDNFIFLSLNSDSFSILDFGGEAKLKFNTTKFLHAITKQINGS